MSDNSGIPYFLSALMWGEKVLYFSSITHQCCFFLHIIHQICLALQHHRSSRHHQHYHVSVRYRYQLMQPFLKRLMVRCRVQRMRLSLAVIRSYAKRAPRWTRQRYKCFLITRGSVALNSAGLRPRGTCQTNQAGSDDFS